jgi:EPS-associated MarR family transcriptional regulator
VPKPTPSQRDRIQEDVQFRLLRLLHQDPELSQRELARAVGISNGGVHYVLSALLEKGLIKFANFTASRDRRRYAYVLTPRGLSEKARLTGDFILRKRAEFEALRAEIAALEQEANEETRSADGASRSLQT